MPKDEDRRALRRHAEDLLKKGPANIGALSGEEIHRLLHELEVYQVELETQNEELRQTQYDLELARDAYADLYDLAPVGYFSVDPSGLIRRVNLTGAAMLGMERKFLLHQQLSKFTATKGADAYFKHRQKAAASRTSESCEIPMLRGDGTPFYAHLESLAIDNAEGGVAEYRSVVTDVSDRKRIEQALYEEKERAQVALQSIGDAVITIDALGLVQYLNPAAETLTGWTSFEAQGALLGNVFDVRDESNDQHALDLVAESLARNVRVRLSDHFVLLNRNGLRYLIEAWASPMHSKAGVSLGVVVVFRDVTEARRMVHELAHHASHDALTGLKNRREFDQRLEHAITSSKEHDSQHALCYMDLDMFKLINDTAGHNAGDELLRQITGLLQNKIRNRDTLARLGGDEFGLLLDNCPLAKAKEIAQMLVSAVHEFRFVWEGRIFQIGVSIGLVPITVETESAGQLLTHADVACYTAKDLGRNQVHVYHQQDSETARRHSEILRVAELREALEQGRFCLYSQPIVALDRAANPCTHCELLLRLVDTQGELVLPKAFIPAAERYGLMASIDRWVIHTALYDYTETLGTSPELEFAINLSGNSLSDDGLLEFIQQQLASSRLSPQQVCFEITETAAIHHLHRAGHLISELRKLGCRFALDDFGSGLSSFTYLKQLPVDYLKIDGTFVRGIASDPVDYAMVAAINSIGHTMAIQTIAESAESDDVVEQLRSLGVDYVQGYAVGSPTRLEVGCASL
jgi:diguanylate cyclase (GGDEF)-like protein/PAS domain S-box-containing protein